ASGSMRAAMGGSTQIDVAKKTIKATIGSIPPDTHVALRVYAHRVEQSDKAKSCVDTELMIPFQTLNAAEFGSKVDSIQPKGYTPIAYTLQQIAGDFGVEREAEKVVILVSDGEETCGGDPVLAVKDLIAKGFKVKVHAVGFNVDAKTQAQLKAIADAGGGKYYDAKDAAGLSSSLKEVTQEALVVQKSSAVYGSEIKGGDSYETAVALAPGQEFHLNHHQKQNQFDYFYVELKGGQGIVFSLNTVQKGVSIDNEKANENTNPYAGFQIHNASRQKLGSEEIIGSANATKTLEVEMTSPQKVYLLIGSTYADMHKDHPFKVEIVDFFDANSGAEAGTTPETAIPLGKKPSTGYLTRTDEADYYKITTTAGENLTIKILPENVTARLEAVLYDDLRAEIAKADSPNEGAGFRLTGAAKGGVTYLKIARSYSHGETTKYSIEFEPAASTP
ncbi:MAG: VWA domain-containing protein, partial [Deltaproteobacteria bacterium]|nr:VWA domain-containing protein [Deltaproteobacteria bacterium]